MIIAVVGIVVVIIIAIVLMLVLRKPAKPEVQPIGVFIPPMGEGVPPQTGIGVGKTLPTPTAGDAGAGPIVEPAAGDCSGCAPGGDCNAACREVGAAGGVCAVPGSTNPAACCACSGTLAQTAAPTPTPTLLDTTAPTPAIPCTFVLHQGKGVVGTPADLTSFPAKTLDGCKSRCCGIPRCKGFTYYAGTCFLKPSHGSLVPLVGSVGGYRN